jgi:hypothetical protein
MRRHGKPIGGPDGRMTVEAASDIVQRSSNAPVCPGDGAPTPPAAAS